MDAERWRRLSPLLDALLELEPPARAQALASMREDDPALAVELEGLLDLEDGEEDFLSEPVLSQLPMARPGVLVGPYRLERLLGEGGMGQVWLASRADGLYQRQVALKLLRPGLADPGFRLRFTRERQILARLGHAHIAHLLDAGISADQQPYLALEYVDGEPITDWCRSRAPGIEGRLRLFLQVCEAVSHAHANLIVHRDLKPSNILVTPTEEVRLLDFGIAKLLDTPDAGPDSTRTGARAFTLHYAAPEQVRGEPVTTMTDVYSLGVVLYEMLAGCKPYRPRLKSDAQWEEAILSADPQRPSVALLRADDADGAPAPVYSRSDRRRLAGDLDTIVLKAMSKAPEQRYASVEAMADDIRRHLAGKPIRARKQGLAYRARKYIGRHRWALGTGAAVTLVLVTALGMVTWQGQQAMQQAARARALQNFVVGLFENAGSAPGGAPLDVRRLLEDGVRRGELELAQQPMALAELLGVVARLRAGLGDYAVALDLQRRQAAIIEAIVDAPANLRLQAATDMGRTQRLLGAPIACRDAMQPLQGLALREQDRSPMLAADFHTEFARCLRDSGAHDAARAGFVRALTLRRATPGHDVGVVENLSDLATLRAAAGQTALALREQAAALRLLRARVGRGHRQAIDILRSMCGLQRELGDLDTAEDHCREALDLSLEIHGAQHRATVDARRQLAAILVDGGRLGEADVILRDAHAWLVSRLGTRHGDVAHSDTTMALVAWERADTEEALAGIRRANATWRALEDRTMLASGLSLEAMILHEAGEHTQAAALLRQALDLLNGAGEGDPGRVGVTWRLIGEVDAERGRTTEALVALQRALAVTQGALGAAHPATRMAELAQAVLEARLGTEGALVRLDHLAELPDADPELRKVAWRARAAAAGLRCHGPRREESRAVLAALDQLVSMERPEGGTVVRDVQRWRQHCAAPTAPAALAAPLSAAEAAAARDRSGLRRASPA